MYDITACLQEHLQQPTTASKIFPYSNILETTLIKGYKVL